MKSKVGSGGSGGSGLMDQQATGGGMVMRQRVSRSISTLSDGSFPSSSDESDETYVPTEDEHPNSQESMDSQESDMLITGETSKAHKIHRFFHSVVSNKSVATLLSSFLIILITVCGMIASFLMWITGISTVVEGLKEILNSTTKGFWQNLTGISVVLFKFLFYLTFVVGLISMLISASVWFLFHYGFIVRSGGYLTTI